MADPETLVPRLAGALDDERLRALALAAVDRFVLSLIDGATSVRDLAETVGIASEEVLASLMKLEAMRVVVLPSSSGGMAIAARASAAAPAAPAADADELDLTPEHQRQIDHVFDHLDSLDHYAILGLARSADRKAIKRAYFEGTSRFHPDRFFRKKLGRYQVKMETVFGRMTEAHDVLTAKDKRAEYDAYLASVQKTRSIEEMLSEVMAEMKRAEDATLGGVVSSIPPAPSSAPAIPAAPSSAPRLAPPPQIETLPGLQPSDPNKRRISVPAIGETADARGRRELLARRLTGGGARSQSPAPPKAPAISYAKTEDAVDALKRRYEEKLAAARTSQARKYMQAGLDARAKGDMVAAANSLRVALSFDADNAELKSAHEEAQRAADGLLLEQYLKQADYEERSEKWPEAGRSWSRVARAQPTNANAHERAAFCLLKADGNLREAVPLAQRAVQLEPKNLDYRKTMANVYLAAGLTLNAKRELEAAVQLAPDDAGVQSLLKRIGKSA